MTCSRPGISGNQAIVQLDSTNLRGFALLKREEDGWAVTQTSHDGDWGLASWETAMVPFDSLTTELRADVPEFEEWSRYPIPFPCPPGEFVHPLTPDESHQIYNSISRGHTAANGFTLPLCNGLETAPAALLAEAKETFDIHLNSAPTRITERLADKGTSVVLLNSDSSPSIMKLLAYWGRDFSLIRVMKIEPGQASVP